jgi:hypothetical protein
MPSKIGFIIEPAIIEHVCVNIYQINPYVIATGGGIKAVIFYLLTDDERFLQFFEKKSIPSIQKLSHAAPSLTAELLMFIQSWGLAWSYLNSNKAF